MTEADSPQGSDTPQPTSAEEVKRKFKEALDRKNQHTARSADHLDGRSKANATHGTASHKREFRRKSG
ncbi:hypothetical protein DFR70_105326 [Nocardia tenerifensis]|uniref:DUF5302 domain-containing protein n=1 Tax=Nocardia tenerifensis TaxID=228006 RepID=A0A318K665_9NOCA|nr:DUF5302 domain-containing protein [Nocardia tenerifensis]PXX64143.1 hypothetical protein DFR70_105326 [Nocardia tenerifensis]